MFPFVYEINAAGWFHLGYFGVFLPLLSVWNRKMLGGPEKHLPNRLRYFEKTAFAIVLFAGFSLAVAHVQWIWLFPLTVPSAKAIIAGGALYVAAVIFMRPRWRRAVERQARVVHLFMPATAAERVWWIAVSFIAGIGEEITWRGVQAALIGALTGSFWIAALASSISFGFTHIIQGWKSAALIVVFALGFHALVWLDGSLYVAMAVHVAYDVTAGIAYGRLGKELGYDPDSVVPPECRLK